jgi:hypothetical protein
MFGQVLLGLFSYDGKFYKYDRVGGDARFIAVAGAPTGRAICMSDERHCFMFGCDGIPGLVRWSNREDYTVWTPLATNRAGSYELQVRSPFQCGVRVRGQVLGLTKTEVFAFTPLQNALVYARDRISTEAGVVGSHAIAVVTDSQGESAYWMGQTDFFAYDGLVRTLDCELRDYVFNDINMVQSSKFAAGVNTQFNEVWFFYCSAASSEVDRGVIYNYADGTWSKATIARLAGQDRGVFQNPIAVDAAGTLYTHEIGKTANGATMPSFVQSHPITIGIGERFADVDQWWPDMQDGSDAAKVSFICRDGPSHDAADGGTVRLRARRRIRAAVLLGARAAAADRRQRRLGARPAADFHAGRESPLMAGPPSNDTRSADARGFCRPDRRIRKATDDDVIIGDGRRLLIRSPNGHFWSITVRRRALSATDMGTTLP